MMDDDRKAYVYVGKDINVSPPARIAYKIGSTYDVAQRQSSAYIGEILFTIECESRAAAYGLEFRLHRYFNYRAVPNRNEWFYLTENEIELVRSGFDGVVVMTDFMLMVAYHHMKRHASAAERFILKPSYVGRIEQIKRAWRYKFSTS